MSLGVRKSKGSQPLHKVDAKIKAQDKIQATTEQLHMALMLDHKNDDLGEMRQMVLQLMETTHRPEEEVCLALHDCDNDVYRACNLLLEECLQGEWQTERKKKKAAATGNGDADTKDELSSRGGRSRGRYRQDGRSRGGYSSNSRDGEAGDIARRGMRGSRSRGAVRGVGRGGFVRGGGGRGVSRGLGRGGRGGGRGPRTNGQTFYRNRGYRSQNAENAPVEDWDMGANDNGPTDNSFPVTEDWDNDWNDKPLEMDTWTSNRGATGANSDSETTSLPSESSPYPTQIESTSYYSQQLKDDPWQMSDVPVVSSVANVGAVSTGLSPLVNEVKPQELNSNQHLSQNVDLHQQLQHPSQPMGMTGTLTAAQSQYLSQLTQQSQQDSQHNVYTSNFNVYTSDANTARKIQPRARVPPPSKIPATPVEMPGESGGNGTTGYLDVQFGALEFDPVAAFNDALDKRASQRESGSEVENSNNTSAVSENSLDIKRLTPVSLPSDSQILPDPVPNVDLVSPAAPSQPAPAPAPPQPYSVGALESQLSSIKLNSISTAISEAASIAPVHHTGTQPALQPYHYQPPFLQPVTPTPPKIQANPYAHISHHIYSENVYQPVNSTTVAATSPYALSQYHTPALNSYQNDFFQTSPVSVYGGSTLNTGAPYNPYQPPSKMSGKDPVQYDSNIQVSSALSSNSASSSQSIKVTTGSGKNTTSSLASSSGNMQSGSGLAYSPQQPAAAAAAAAAYYAQQQQQNAPYAAYAAEKAHMMRGTLPHHMTGYYEVPTGYGATTRDGAFAGLGGAGGADARFARADAASPQQPAPAPLPAAAGPPVYAYFYGANLMAPTPSPAGPPPYQYQSPQPVYQYGSGGGAGGSAAKSTYGGTAPPSQSAQPQYDTQAPDSYKQGYPSAGGGGGGKSGGGSSAGAGDLYASKHVALTKVNSYDKAAFHSGTPPPFGLGAAGVFIPTVSHHHSHQQPAPHQDNGAGTGARGTGVSAKAAQPKQQYSQSYWAPN